MNPLRKSVRDYLRLRRGLGFKLGVAEVRLGQFPLPSHRNVKKGVGNFQKTCHTAGI